jgi:hypothetical protein
MGHASSNWTPLGFKYVAINGICLMGQGARENVRVMGGYGKFLELRTIRTPGEDC